MIAKRMGAWPLSQARPPPRLLPIQIDRADQEGSERHNNDEGDEGTNTIWMFEGMILFNPL